MATNKDVQDSVAQVDRIFAQVMDADMWIRFGLKLLIALIIIAGFYILMRILTGAVSRLFTIRKINEHDSLAQRQNETLLKLLQNAIRYVLGIVMLLTVLSQFGINITGLVASAGIAGLAISFGAKNLVQDIITGAFIIFERQFKVGDFVRVGLIEGVVTELGIRTTKLKGLNGEIHIIPNGQILQVTNFSVDNSFALVDVQVSYEEDLERVEQVLHQIANATTEKYTDMFIEPIQMLGVQTLGPSEVVYRLMAEVPPMQHFQAGRLIRKELKQGLELEGIKIPYPRMVMMNTEQGNGGQADGAKNVQSS
ncbi:MULTISPECIES: mechanosensitive ion channel family protein [Exiguobacterium]|uniref:mechanosensitive ion channel family protein n=1 Tax=Exiguobacterium TaxID=33986 RepID=UPI001BE8F4A8|nr:MULTISPECIES: mechanosensitive ion channel family protein [Exiguobacterium]MCT4793233.1 mechanosensitive ion channel family protein [Exiguobacterium artemiae]MDW2885229.1 mechanosensitive ion channel family protein [Exiguobacterium sibiricum]MDX1260087.1 mechanosensitive ion channel family protein [Exiguobacterium sp. K1]